MTVESGSNRRKFDLASYPVIFFVFGTPLIVLLVLAALGILSESSIDLVCAASGFFVGLIYFPTLIITTLRRNSPAKRRIMVNIGILGVSLWVIGFVFIQLRLPGRVIPIFFGAFFFILNFLPGWWAARRGSIRGAGRILLLSVCLFFGTLMFYALARTMQYPFRDGAGLVALGIFVGVLVPAVIACYVKKCLFSFSFSEAFVFLFLAGHILANLQVSKIRDDRFSRTTENQERVEKSIDLYWTKSKFLYEAFDRLPKDDINSGEIFAKCNELKEVSDSLYFYIHHVKTHLVSSIDQIPWNKADTTNFSGIINKTERDRTTFILLGTLDGQLNNGKYSAVNLRKRLTEYSMAVNNLLPEESRLFFSQNSPIRFSDSNEFIDGIRQTWETVNFLHNTLATVYTHLTSLQADVRYVEMIAVGELFNFASGKSKKNVAAQLAELAMKFENEKKEKQISILQKDRQLHEERMKAKDLALSQKEKILLYFVVASAVFLLLVVMVIRANMLRRKANLLLQQQKDEISRQKSALEVQKQLVEEKQNEILDSIRYAKRLQQAILPPAEFLDRHIPENFILYLPKDVVAGDFYWAETRNGLFYFAVADSTGHGVPGAMVSVVCSNALNRAVKEFGRTEPGQILDKTRELILETFEKSNSAVNDGMDISLICLNRSRNELSWSGANNSLWYIEDGQLIEIVADKQPVGRSYNSSPFSTHRIGIQPGTVLYLITDGFADQFGGPKGKKFKYRQLQEILVAIHRKPPEEQLELLKEQFSKWRGSLEQVDDVTIAGIRT